MAHQDIMANDFHTFFFFFFSMLSLKLLFPVVKGTSRCFSPELTRKIQIVMNKFLWLTCVNGAVFIVQRGFLLFLLFFSSLLTV